MVSGHTLVLGIAYFGPWTSKNCHIGRCSWHASTESVVVTGGYGHGARCMCRTRVHVHGYGARACIRVHVHGCMPIVSFLEKCIHIAGEISRFCQKHPKYSQIYPKYTLKWPEMTLKWPKYTLKWPKMTLKWPKYT